MPKTKKPKPTINQTDIDNLIAGFSQVFATKEELNEIKDNLISGFSQLFATKEELNEIKEKIEHLPTKEEFYEKEDELMGELKAIRENQEIITQHAQDQFDRIESLEALHSPSHSHFSRS